jgi:hypothetical protein
MAQDERKGHTASARGRLPASSAPDTADAHGMHAPPSPEAPGAPQSQPATEPVDTAAGQGTADAGESGNGGDTGGGSAGGGSAGGGSAGGGTGGAGTGGGAAGGASEIKELKDKIDQANKNLDVLKAQLTLAEDLHRATEATEKMVGDYAKEREALKATEEELIQYRAAEALFLSKFLDDAKMKAIAKASAEQQQKIDDLTTKIKTDERTAADKRAHLDKAKAEAAAAKAEAEALKRPAASIRDRLKAADAIRTEAMKASDSGNYALAYWLIMDHGRLDEKIKGKPRIIPESDLKAAVEQSAANQIKAEQLVAALEGEVKTLDAGLLADRAMLASLSAKNEATVRDILAQFNPKSAEAA